MENFYSSSWEFKFVQPFKRNVWKFIMHVYFDPIIPLYNKSQYKEWKDVCMQLLRTFPSQGTVVNAWTGLSFYCSAVRVLVFSVYKPLIKYYFEFFLPFHGLSFYFLDGVFWNKKLSNFDAVCLIFLLLLVLLRDISENPLPNPS